MIVKMASEPKFYKSTRGGLKLAFDGHRCSGSCGLNLGRHNCIILVTLSVTNGHVSRNDLY